MRSIRKSNSSLNTYCDASFETLAWNSLQGGDCIAGAFGYYISLIDAAAVSFLQGAAGQTCVPSVGCAGAAAVSSDGLTCAAGAPVFSATAAFSADAGGLPVVLSPTFIHSLVKSLMVANFD